MSIEPVSGAPAPTPTRAVDERVQRAAEGFERVLLGQLSRTLLHSAMPDAGPASASGPYADLLSDALTEALMGGGGIGLGAVVEDRS